jgi:hypothetical protein
MNRYWLTNGTDQDWTGATDRWGQCYANSPYDDRCDAETEGYLRKQPGVFGDDNMIVYEPCNYVSNVAYYRSATRICDYPNWTLPNEYILEFKRGFTTLAMGSAMWHASHTALGIDFDKTLIGMISYIGYQAIVANLPGDSSILRDLSDTPRQHTGVEVSANLTNWLRTQPAEQWGEALNTLDIESTYELVFSCLISAIFAIIFPWFIVNTLITALATALVPEQAPWVINKYLPVIKEATRQIKITSEETKTILMQFFGMILKIVLAFVYQELLLPYFDVLYGPIPMQIAALGLPYYNEMASRISQFPQTDENVNNAKNVYPGDDQCRNFSPHALWHEESAAGFLEIIFLADTVNFVTSDHHQMTYYK